MLYNLVSPPIFWHLFFPPRRDLLAHARRRVLLLQLERVPCLIHIVEFSLLFSPRVRSDLRMQLQWRLRLHGHSHGLPISLLLPQARDLVDPRFPDAWNGVRRPKTPASVLPFLSILPLSLPTTTTAIRPLYQITNILQRLLRQINSLLHLLLQLQELCPFNIGAPIILITILTHGNFLANLFSILIDLVQIAGDLLVEADRSITVILSRLLLHLGLLSDLIASLFGDSGASLLLP